MQVMQQGPIRHSRRKGESRTVNASATGRGRRALSNDVQLDRGRETTGYARHEKGQTPLAGYRRIEEAGMEAAASGSHQHGPVTASMCWGSIDAKGSFGWMAFTGVNTPQINGSPEGWGDQQRVHRLLPSRPYWDRGSSCWVTDGNRTLNKIAGSLPPAFGLGEGGPVV